MHVRCDNQYKSGAADGGNILVQPRLFECMGIRVLSPAPSCEMRGFPRLSTGCKILIPPISSKFSHIIWDWTALSWIFFFFWGGGIFSNMFREVCRPYHIQGVCSKSELICWRLFGHYKHFALALTFLYCTTLLLLSLNCCADFFFFFWGGGGRGNVAFYHFFYV